MERWMVIHNCHTHGLCNSLTVLNSEVSIEPCDISVYKTNAEIRKSLGDYHHLLVSREVKQLQLVDFANYSHTEVPTVYFPAYHPDLCYASSNGKEISTFTGPYNSIICLLAYQNGLTEEETFVLYQWKTYEALGYFDQWSVCKQKLHADFEDHGYDLAPYFTKWGLHSSFMYSVNHPKMICLFDMSRMITQKMGRPVPKIPPELYPYDNMQAGAVFAIYPEIAERYGVEGSYFFKAGCSNNLMDLRAFIAFSYARYREQNIENVTLFSDHNQELISDRFRTILAKY